MSDIPEGVQTVAGEGQDLASAITAAAEELGIEAKKVAYKLDLDHFRSNMGTSKPADTVKIIAWDSPDGDGNDLFSGGGGQKRSSNKRERRSDSRGRKSDSRGRKSDSRGRKSDSRGRKSGSRGRKSGSRDRKSGGRNRSEPEGEPTEASKAAKAWLDILLEQMNLEAKVEATGTDDRIHIMVEAEKAGRVVGRRGSTLSAIRQLLSLVLEPHGSFRIDVDVNGEEEKKKRGGRKSRSSGSRNRRSGSRRKGTHPPKKLKALARRAAEKAIESGKTVTLNLELNSYDRRVVHMEVSEIDGVDSQSEEKDGVKYVQVIPDGE